MIANIFYQKDITRRIQSLYSSVSSVYSVPPCEALKTPKMGKVNNVRPFREQSDYKSLKIN